MVFSPGAKAFSFGHPSMHTIIDRFLNGGPAEEEDATQMLIRAIDKSLCSSVNECPFANDGVPFNPLVGVTNGQLPLVDPNGQGGVPVNPHSGYSPNGNGARGWSS